MTENLIRKSSIKIARRESSLREIKLGHEEKNYKYGDNDELMKFIF